MDCTGGGQGLRHIGEDLEVGTVWSRGSLEVWLTVTGVRCEW